MTQNYKELKEIADKINSWNFLDVELEVNRRNGYYAIDRYESDGTYKGAMFTGDFKEVHAFLTGIKYANFFQLPF